MTDETRPIILVTGCHRYFPFLVAAVKRFSHPAVRVIGFVGIPPSSSSASVEEPTLTTVKGVEILELPVLDTYEALPTKVHAALSWAATAFPRSPGIWKTDDDIVHENTAALVEALWRNQAIPYWGLMTDACRAGPINQRRIVARFCDTSLRPDHQAAIYCWGAGYWLSREALSHVVTAAAAAVFAASYLEDVATGFVMNSARIFPDRGVSRTIPFKEMPR